jgi:RNA polymerase sigma factor (sigma-70 family)
MSLQPHEELGLIFKAQRGDQKAIDRLFSSYEKYLEMLSSKFTIPGFEPDDIKQEAVCGFMRSIETFDPSKKVKFSTHTYNSVSGYLKNRLRKVVGRNKEGSFATSGDVSYHIATATCFSGIASETGGSVEDQVEDKPIDASFGVSSSPFEDVEFNFLHERVLSTLAHDAMKTVYLLLIDGTTLPEIEKITGLTKTQVFSLRERLKPIAAQVISGY